jgi:hypothetical protein
MSNVRKVVFGPASAFPPPPAIEQPVLPRVLVNRRMTPSFQRSIASPISFSQSGDAGGILLGKFLPGRPLTLLIEGFHALAWDGERGGAPHLMGPHTRLLEQTIAQYQNQPPVSVIGFYRSSRTGELELTHRDRDLFNQYFHDPFSIYMLVRPISYNMSIGAIFWQSHQDDRDASTTIEIGFDNETSYLAEPRRSFSSRARQWGRTAAQVVTVAAGLALPIGYMAWQSSDESADTAADTATDTRVQLNLLRTGSDLLITWKRMPGGGSPLVSGRLTISDSGYRKEFLLDREQMASGRMLYQPLTNDVTVRMEARNTRDVRVSDTMRSFRQEPVPAPALTADRVAMLATTGGPPVREHVIQVQARATRESEEPAELTDPEPEGSPALRSRFTPPPPGISPNGTGVPAPVMLEPPPLTAITTAELRTPVHFLQQPRAIPTPSWEQAEQEAAVETPPGYDFTAAVALHSPKPQYPRNSIPSLTGTVDVAVKAHVSSTGEVVSTQTPVPAGTTEKLLAIVAEKTAKKWKFRPAKLNGRPVPSEVTINFRFVP